jgi:hypothetical protein
MGKQKLFICISLVILLFTVSCIAEVATATLKNLVIYSNVIVLGKVVKISTVQHLKIAEVEVMEVLKGQINSRVLYYRANPLWACDASGGKEQEVGIYFYSDPINVSTLSEEDPELGKKLNAVIQNNNFFNLTWEGQGRFVIETAAHNRLPIYKTKSDFFPTSDKVAWTLTSGNLEIGSVRFEDVISYIKAQK